MVAVTSVLVRRPRQKCAARRLRAGRWNHAFGLGAGALILSVVTALYQFVLPLTSGRSGLPSAGLIDRLWLWRTTRVTFDVLTPDTGGSATVAILCASVVGFAAYGISVGLLWRRPPTRRLVGAVAGVGVVLLVVGVLALPNTSTDIYSYLLTARVLTEHGANPLVTAPDAFPDDPLWPLADRSYTARADNKLPLWLLFSLPLTALGGDDPVRSLLVLRAGLAVIGVVNIALIVLVLRRIAPRHVCAGTALFAWNPIIAVHSTAKTDTLMVTFLLAAVLLSLRDLQRWATAASAASALIKVFSAPFTAVLLFGQVRSSARPLREVVIRSALVLGVTLGTYQVFAPDPTLIFRHLLNTNSPGTTGGPLLSAGVATGLVALTGLTALRQDGSVQRYLATVAPLALYATAFIGYIGFSWYVFVPLALLSLVRDTRAATAVILITAVHATRNAMANADIGDFHLVLLPSLPAGVLTAVLLLLALSPVLPAAGRQILKPGSTAPP